MVVPLQHQVDTVAFEQGSPLSHIAVVTGTPRARQRVLPTGLRGNWPPNCPYARRRGVAVTLAKALEYCDNRGFAIHKPRRTFMNIQWLGHNCWQLTIGEQKVLIDPFLNDSPTAPVNADDVTADYLLVSHGHFDHIADAVSIANRTGATVLTNFEIGNWLAAQGVAADHVIGMNHGGSYDLPFGRVEYTIAHHSSSLPDSSYGGNPGGFVVAAEDRRVYFACDTAAFLEMKMIGAAGLDLAVVPIGDLYTMGPASSLEAIKLLAPKKVLPCHYNTFPPITQDAAAWARSVKQHTSAEPVVLEPGESLEI